MVVCLLEQGGKSEGGSAVYFPQWTQRFGKAGVADVSLPHIPVVSSLGGNRPLYSVSFNN